MKKYFVTYISKTDNDCCTVWVDAFSKEEARSEVEAEYWDIKEIISIKEGK